ncbi:MAG: ATP-binding cassette domain-containing protein [Burkholderiaceae bacterium]
MNRFAALQAWAGPLLLLSALLILPWAGGDFIAYQVALFLLYGVAAQGVALCWGQLGFLPLGHALFFGLGAYLSGGLLKAARHDEAWLMLLPLAVLLPAAFACVIARLVFARSHRSGPYFSLITLALTMLGALLANRFSALTGGFNGMTDIPELPGLERYSAMYWAVAALALASTLGLSFMIRRPIGVLWKAIAQNEDRLQFFGFATDRIKAWAFALSALCAAAAGALFAPLQGIVTPQALGFVLSTELVIWAAVGGKSSPLGALLGAVLVGYASSELRDHFASWEVIVAVAFLLVVRFLPEGVSGMFARRSARSSSQTATTPILAPALRFQAGVDASPPSLVFEDVHSAHAGVTILNGMSLRFEGPGVRCLIGPNGAGKTSAFNVLTGRLPALSGRMRLGSNDVSGWNAWRVARAGLGRKFQIPSVFAALTVRENIAIALWANRLRYRHALAASPLRWHTPLADEMLTLFPTLRDHLDEPAGQLAQGDRQALEFVMTVLPEPRLMLLDEPCAGLSSAETQRMMGAIASVAGRIGAAALVIEHDMGAVETIAEHVYVMHQGRLLAEGSLADVQADAAVRAVYAGGRK